jgi:hypothetical protein
LRADQAAKQRQKEILDSQQASSDAMPSFPWRDLKNGANFDVSWQKMLIFVAMPRAHYRSHLHGGGGVSASEFHGLHDARIAAARRAQHQSTDLIKVLLLC